MLTFSELIQKVKAKGKTTIDLSYQYPALTDEDILDLVNSIQENRLAIENLRLSENDLGDEATISLAKLNNLKFLSISTNNITDNGAKHIACIVNLSKLEISDNLVTDEGIEYLISNLSNLKSLTVSGSSIGLKAAQAILKHNLLEELTISDKSKLEIDNKLLKHILDHMESNKKRNEISRQVELNNSLNRLTLSNNKQPQFFQQESKLVEENKNIFNEKIPGEDEFIAELIKLDTESRKQYLDKFIARLNNATSSSYDNR